MANVVTELGAAKQTIDYTLGVSVLTAPAWVQYLQNASVVVAFIAAIGGAILVWVRVRLALIELKQRKNSS